MSEKKQLNDEELEKVTGGRVFSNPSRSEYFAYNREISCDDCNTGEKYLLVHRSDPDEWIFGSIYNTYREYSFFGFNRILDIIVTDGNKINVTNSGGTYEVYGSHYHVYKK